MKLAKLMFWFAVAFLVLGIGALSISFAASSVWWIIVVVGMVLTIAALVSLVIAAVALMKADDAKTAASLKDYKAPKAY